MLQNQTQGDQGIEITIVNTLTLSESTLERSELEGDSSRVNILECTFA